MSTNSRPLLAVLLAGVAGSLLDLVLLRHYDGATQVIPIAVLIAGAAAIVAHAWLGTRLSLRLLQVAMGIFLFSAVLGMYLHFDGNREFQLEVDATQRGWPLFLKVIRAHSPPALAPGAMGLLGLLGLIYAKATPAADRSA